MLRTVRTLVRDTLQGEREAAANLSSSRGSVRSVTVVITRNVTR
jgi:hypothetical protein